MPSGQLIASATWPPTVSSGASVWRRPVATQATVRATAGDQTTVTATRTRHVGGGRATTARLLSDHLAGYARPDPQAPRRRHRHLDHGQAEGVRAHAEGRVGTFRGLLGKQAGSPAIRMVHAPPPGPVVWNPTMNRRSARAGGTVLPPSAGSSPPTGGPRRGAPRVSSGRIPASAPPALGHVPVELLASAALLRHWGRPVFFPIELLIQFSGESLRQS